MGKSIRQVEAEWITHGNIARLQYSLETEMDVGRRQWLEGLLKEQRTLAAASDDTSVLDAVTYLE